MPRVARIKSQDSLYHVMSRSISEINLFRGDEDKDYYLKLLKKYIDKLKCKIYAYCIMDNHVHLYINPQGFDISSFMLALNTAYVCYYNKKYNRHGHLFQGRFASRIVDSESYSLSLSAYIHNNAKDLPDIRGKEARYQYSSYGIYTGERKDVLKIVDTDFILEAFHTNKRMARNNYRTFVESRLNMEIIQEIDNNIILEYTENEYKSENQKIIRDFSPEELIKRISNLVENSTDYWLRAKYIRGASQFRAFVTYVMRVLCGYTYKDICKYIGNMSVSGVNRLSQEGFKLLKDQIHYRNAFNFLIETN